MNNNSNVFAPFQQITGVSSAPLVKMFGESGRSYAHSASAVLGRLSSIANINAEIANANFYNNENIAELNPLPPSHPLSQESGSIASRTAHDDGLRRHRDEWRLLKCQLASFGLPNISNIIQQAIECDPEEQTIENSESLNALATTLSTNGNLPLNNTGIVPALGAAMGLGTTVAVSQGNIKGLKGIENSNKILSKENESNYRSTTNEFALKITKLLVKLQSGQTNQSLPQYLGVLDDIRSLFLETTQTMFGNACLSIKNDKTSSQNNVLRANRLFLEMVSILKYHCSKLVNEYSKQTDQEMYADIQNSQIEFNTKPSIAFLMSKNCLGFSRSLCVTAFDYLCDRHNKLIKTALTSTGLNYKSLNIISGIFTIPLNPDFCTGKGSSLLLCLNFSKSEVFAQSYIADCNETKTFLTTVVNSNNQNSGSSAINSSVSVNMKSASVNQAPLLAYGAIRDFPGRVDLLSDNETPVWPFLYLLLRCGLFFEFINILDDEHVSRVISSDLKELAQLCIYNVLCITSPTYAQSKEADAFAKIHNFSKYSANSIKTIRNKLIDELNSKYVYITLDPYRLILYRLMCTISSFSVDNGNSCITTEAPSNVTVPFNLSAILPSCARNLYDILFFDSLTEIISISERVFGEISSFMNNKEENNTGKKNNTIGDSNVNDVVNSRVLKGFFPKSALSQETNSYKVETKMEENMYDIVAKIANSETMLKSLITNLSKRGKSFYSNNNLILTSFGIDNQIKLLPMMAFSYLIAGDVTNCILTLAILQNTQTTNSNTAITTSSAASANAAFLASNKAQKANTASISDCSLYDSVLLFPQAIVLSCIVSSMVNQFGFIKLGLRVEHQNENINVDRLNINSAMSIIDSSKMVAINSGNEYIDESDDKIITKLNFVQAAVSNINFGSNGLADYNDGITKSVFGSIASIPTYTNGEQFGQSIFNTRINMVVLLLKFIHFYGLYSYKTISISTFLRSNIPDLSVFLAIFFSHFNADEDSIDLVDKLKQIINYFIVKNGEFTVQERHALWNQFPEILKPTFMFDENHNEIMAEDFTSEEELQASLQSIIILTQKILYNASLIVNNYNNSTSSVVTDPYIIEYSHLKTKSPSAYIGLTSETKNSGIYASIRLLYSGGFTILAAIALSKHLQIIAGNNNLVNSIETQIALNNSQYFIDETESMYNEIPQYNPDLQGTAVRLEYAANLVHKAAILLQTKSLLAVGNIETAMEIFDKGGFIKDDTYDNKEDQNISLVLVFDIALTLIYTLDQTRLISRETIKSRAANLQKWSINNGGLSTERIGELSQFL